MSKNDKAKAERAKNYSAEQEQILRDRSPLDLESAKALADEMGKGYRSIIAKVKSMGLPYVVKKTEPKKVAKETKAQLVEKISASLEGADLDGLEKSTAQALVNLLQAVNV